MKPKTETQHVVPHDGKWGIRAEKSDKPSKVFETKLLAIMKAFDIAGNNNGKVVIHEKNGTISEIKATEDASKLVTALKGSMPGG